MRDGCKRSHWMWYIFPQLRGLGRSDTAWRFGIKGTEEAKEYVEHPVLGPRLVEITKEVLNHKDKTPSDIFGYIDDIKMRSCMTLFELVSDEPVFGKVLDTFYNGERDDKTMEVLEQRPWDEE